MPLVKIDAEHPEILYAVLKDMDVPDGAQLEVERVEAGILFKPAVFAPTSVEPYPIVTATERNRIFEQLRQRAATFPDDDPGFDSDDMIRVIQEARTISEPKSFD